MLFKKIIGIDLGTSFTKIYLKETGIVFNEPSIVAFNNRTNRVISVGFEAKKMLARTPIHITALKPVINGTIGDFDMTKEMLVKFFKTKSLPHSFITYGITAIPTNLTEVERKSVEDLLREVGINKVYLVEKPLAAALGIGLDISQPSAHLIVDVGAGSTDMGVVSFNGVVVAKRLKIAGDYLNQEIIKGVKEEFKLYIGEPTAEEIKITVGSLLPQTERLEVVIRGRDVSSGLPKEMVIKDTQVRYWLQKPVKTIIENLKELIDITPAELAGDIYKNGIYLVGGGSLLRGFGQLVEKEIGVKVKIGDDPMLSVVRGLGIITENLKFYTDILETF
jgi:rod shape-determining protein MreB